MTISGFLLTVVLSGIVGWAFGYAFGQDFEVRSRNRFIR